MKHTALIRIDVSSRVPAYEQIVGEIRALLVAGELEVGAPLPPVRQLAVDLNVHHNTVAQAYRILAEEGWLDLHHGRGARVSARSKPRRPGPAAHRTFRLQLRRLLAEAVAGGLAPGLIAQQLVLHAHYVKTWASTKGDCSCSRMAR